MEIEIPGYRHIKWSSVKNKDEVFLQGRSFQGRSFIEPHAYGPYVVEDASRRTLRNSKGNEFMHYAEDLIIPTKKSQKNKLKIYKISCDWRVYGIMEIEATSLEEAIAIASDEGSSIPTADGFIEGSFKINREMTRYFLEERYGNDRQK